MGRKSIKKILRIILWAITIFVVLDLMIVGLFFIPPIQQAVVNSVTNSVSEKMTGKFYIEKIYVTPTFKIKAKNVTFKDHHDNNMIFVESLKGKIKLRKCSKEGLFFGKVTAEGADVIIRVYKGEKSSNISIWAKKFKPEKKREKPFTLLFDHLILNDSRLLVQNDRRWKNDGTTNMDYGYYEMKEMNADLNKFSVIGDDISCFINAIAYSQYSGFKMKQLSGDFRINKKGLTLQKAKIITANSQLNCDFRFIYNSYKDYSKFVDCVSFDVRFSTSTFNFKDLQCFAPKLKGMDNTILMQGRMVGPLRDFNLENMQVQYGLQSHISGDFAFKDIIHFKNALFNIDINNTQIDINELAAFKLPNDKTIAIPDMIKKLGKIDLDFQFAGYLSHFQTKLYTKTKLGNINAFLNAFPDNLETKYVGKISSPTLNLGQLTKQAPLLGKSALTLNINGKSDPIGKSDNFSSSLKASIDGDIDYFDFCNYPIKNIILFGNIANNKYSVDIQSNDKNLNLNLGGSVNLSGNKPIYHASLSVKNLATGEIFSHYPKKIDTTNAKGIEKLVLLAQKFPTFNIQFDTMDIEIIGNKIENLHGYFKTDKISIQNDSNSTFCERISVSIPDPVSNNKHQLILHSSFLTVNLETNYELHSIIDSLHNVVAYYLPQFFEKKHFNNEISTKKAKNHYFNLQAKSFFARDILNFINPKIHLSRTAELNIHLADNRNDDSFIINIPFLKIDNKIKINSLVLNSKTGIQDTFNIDLQSDSLVLLQKNNRFAFHDIDLNTKIKDNIVNYDLNWISPEAIASQKNNNINGWLKGSYNDRISVKIVNSQIYVKNSPVQFAGKNLFTFKDKIITIDDCQIKGDLGNIALNGTFSKVTDASLNAELQNIDMSIINSLLASNKLSFNGLLSAQVILNMRNAKSSLIGKTYISKFAFNDVKFGDIFLLASASSQSETPMFTGGIFTPEDTLRQVNIKEYTHQKYMNEPHRHAKITGFYEPQRKEIQINASSIENLDIHFLTPFLSSFSNCISGDASGNLSFIYNPDSLFFLGDVTVQDGTLNIAPLNTTYKLNNQTITFNPKGIEFHKVQLLDDYDNTAFLNGEVYHDHFKDFKINLAIETDRILILNTDKTPDSYFCGKGFVSGNVTIKGDTKKLSFFGENLQTLKGTEMIFPVSSAGKISDTKGIRFTAPIDAPISQVVTSNNHTAMDFDFTFKVTKDAGVRVDLEPIDGTLNCVTNGELHLKYNSHNQPLTLDGSLSILNGKFNMSLKDLLPREFDIVEGGSINFQGPFSKSAVSISALYSKNSSVNSISNQLNIGRTQVNAYLNLNGALMNPSTSFAFSFPKLTAEEQMNVFNALDTTNKQNTLRQFFSFVFFNTFLASDLSVNSLETQSIGSGIDMLAGMINGVLSQQLKYLDIGIDYYSNENQYREYSINAAIPLYNDRILVKTRFGLAENVSGASASQNSFVGNVSVEYKINEEGNWMGRFFYFNDEYEVNYDASRPQQGGGIALLYQQDFNNKVKYLKKGDIPVIETRKRKK